MTQEEQIRLYRRMEKLNWFYYLSHTDSLSHDLICFVYSSLVITVFLFE